MILVNRLRKALDNPMNAMLFAVSASLASVYVAGMILLFVIEMIVK